MKNLRALLFVVVVFLVGCASVPVYAPQIGMTKEMEHSVIEHVTKLPVFIDIKKNKFLKTYLDEMTLHNKNLKSLSTSIRAFELQSDVVNAQILPSASLEATKERQKLANNQQVSMNIRWAVDLWGKLGDESYASKLRVEQQRLEYDNALLVIIAQAIQTWLDLWVSQELQQLLIERIVLSTNLTASVEESFQIGRLSYDSLIQQRNINLRLNEPLTHLTSKYQINLHKFNVLRGQAPLTMVSDLNDSLEPVIVNIPTNITSIDLLNRPDVQAAFKQIEILDSETKAAHKALLPQINLSGSFNDSTFDIVNSLQSGTVWRLVGGLVQPLFNGGQLSNLAKQKSREAEGSLYRYEQVVLGAMQEVENWLSEEISLLQKMAIVEKRLEEMNQLVESHKNAYLTDGISVQEFLNTQEQLLNIKNDWIVDQYNYLSNRTELALSLGHLFKK